METNQLSISEAHRICGELFFAFKLLEKEFYSMAEEGKRLAETNEKLKAELLLMKKEFGKDGISRERVPGQ